jgi:hypothetical protein
MRVNCGFGTLTCELTAFAARVELMDENPMAMILGT